LDHHFKAEPCPACEGRGIRQIKYLNHCQAMAETTGKKCRVIWKSPEFPCQVCRPAEYAITAGVELRNQGRYAEAINAAMKIDDTWSAAETMGKGGATPKGAKAAGVDLYLKDLRALQEAGRRFPPGHKYRRIKPGSEIGGDAISCAKIEMGCEKAERARRRRARQKAARNKLKRKAILRREPPSTQEPPSEGNGVNPEQATEFRKQEFAAMETGAVAVTKHDNSDGLDIPEYLRRVAP